jgi:hypothetical protein
MTLDTFLRLKAEKIRDAQVQEANGSKAMAYIALWSIVEKTLSNLESQRLEEKLKSELNQWINFLGNKDGSPPRNIKNFSFEAVKLPNPQGVKLLLGDAPAICKLIQTKAKGKSSKFRDKRNAIAHSAEDFKELSTFQEYKSTVLSAIDELEIKLMELE